MRWMVRASDPKAAENSHSQAKKAPKGRALAIIPKGAARNLGSDWSRLYSIPHVKSHNTPIKPRCSQAFLSLICRRLWAERPRKDVSETRPVTSRSQIYGNSYISQHLITKKAPKGRHSGNHPLFHIPVECKFPFFGRKTGLIHSFLHPRGSNVRPIRRSQ